MKIKAALFGRSDGPELVTAELAPPRAHEVRVRLVATGICHTDVKAMAPGGLVPHPVVLGHEGAGYVDALGAGVTSLSEGDAVVLSFAHCGACPSCDDAAPAYCHHSAALNFGCEGAAPIAVEGAHVHGGFFGQSSFATYANVDARHAIKLAPDMPLARMAPLGCGVQTGAGAILNVLKPEAGARVVVFGAGSVGLSAVMAAALTPAQMIIAVDRNAGRLETAKEIGATHALLADGTLEAELARLLGHGADVVLDTTGVPDVIYQGLMSLAPRGRMGYVTSPWDGRDVAIPGRHMLWGRSLTGIIQGSSQPQAFIPKLADLVMSGAFDIDRIITTYPFHRIAEAIDDMKAGTAIKPVLLFDP